MGHGPARPFLMPVSSCGIAGLDDVWGLRHDAPLISGTTIRFLLVLISLMVLGGIVRGWRRSHGGIPPEVVPEAKAPNAAPPIDPGQD